MIDFYAGLLSGVISTFICNPFDVARIHKQLNMNDKKKVIYSKKSIFNSDFINQHIKNTLFDSFKSRFRFYYQGITISLITIPAFWSIYFSTYKFLKNNDYFNVGNKSYSFLNGYTASCFASTITSPLWFIRQKKQLNSNFNTVNFFQNNGIRPFYKGLFATYLINATFIIQIPLYEYLKEKYVTQVTQVTELTYEYECKHNYQIWNYLNDSTKIFIISAFSKTIASSLYYPIDTIRAFRRNSDLSIINIISKLNKNPLNYYNGLTFYLIRSIPYHATTFCVFEYLQKFSK